MKVAVFKGCGRGLKIESRPEPEPGPGEVLIKVGRVGICASDLHMTSGHGQQYPADSVFGHECSGEVVAIGSGVTHIHRGDRLAPMPFVGCGHCRACHAGQPHRCTDARTDVVTGYSQYSLVGVNDCVLLPPALSDEEGALIEPLAVGLQAVRKAGMAIGARVLVMGAGPIGLACAFWADRLGASQVVVTARSSRRSGIARTLGAGGFIASNEVDDLQPAIEQALGGAPDVVFEAVGASGMIARAIDSVRPAGTVVVLGFFSDPETFLPTIALFKEIRLLFSMCYDRSDFKYVADVMAAGDHRPAAMITSSIAFDALPERFERLRTESSDCKVMVAPWQ